MARWPAAPLAVPFLVAALLLPAAARADYAKGIAAYVRADYRTAVAEFAASARAGDAQSQYMLGRLYAMGLGVPTDLVQAWVWDERAARAGVTEANADRAGIESILTPAQLALARSAAGAGPPLPEVAITDLGAFPPVDRESPVQLRQDTLASGMPAVDGVTAPPPELAPPSPQPPRAIASAGERAVVLVPRRAHLSAPGPTWEGRMNAMGQLQEQVRGLQAGLDRAGYAAGPADGRLGPQTRQALRQWQLDHGRSPTGIITPELVAGIEQSPAQQQASR